MYGFSLSILKELLFLTVGLVGGYIEFHWMTFLSYFLWITIPGKEWQAALMFQPPYCCECNLYKNRDICLSIAQLLQVIINSSFNLFLNFVIFVLFPGFFIAIYFIYYTFLYGRTFFIQTRNDLIFQWIKIFLKLMSSCAYNLINKGDKALNNNNIK